MPVLWMFYYFRTGGIALYLQAAIYNTRVSGHGYCKMKNKAHGREGIWKRKHLKKGDS